VEIKMYVSGAYTCHTCGHVHEYEKLEIPDPPYKIPCEKCGAAIIESIPDDILESMQKAKSN
jgi:hypothetical protein